MKHTSEWMNMRVEINRISQHLDLQLYYNNSYHLFSPSIFSFHDTTCMSLLLLSFTRKLSEMTSNLSAQQTHWHSGDYPCELINVKVFFLRAGNFWPSYITFTCEQLIAPWSNHDLKSKKKGHALRNLLFGEIYDTTSTDSVTHSKSTFIAQQPSNLLACSRSNLSLLFIKCVTVNCRVLSEWQFNFHCLHYWLPLLSNVAMMVHHHLSIGDIFIHNNISARRVNVRPL